MQKRPYDPSLVVGAKKKKKKKIGRRDKGQKGAYNSSPLHVWWEKDVGWRRGKGGGQGGESEGQLLKRVTCSYPLSYFSYYTNWL